MGRIPNSAIVAATLALSIGLTGCGRAESARQRATVHDSVVSSQQARFRIVSVAEGLARPWGIAFLPGGAILVTERPGRLRLVEGGRLRPEPIAGVPGVHARGQGGLLDVVLDPDFASNGWLYLSYSAAAGRKSATRVMRARYTPQGLENQTVIFEAKPRTGTNKHFGSRLAFGPDGLLYITTGDRGERRRAQKLSDHNGSIVRLRPDGSVPEDNPFVGDASARPEIWSYGHRNVQGLAFQPGTGLLFASEHGPQGGDEINLIRPGDNYGWPVVSHGQEYGGGRIGSGTEQDGMANPLWVWTPSIAPSGLAFYDGGVFPEWRGDLFVGALAHRLLVRLEIEDDRVVRGERLLTDTLGRIRDVRSGPDGLLYLLTDSQDGALYRLEPAG